MGGNCNPFGGEKFPLPFAYVTLWVQLKRKKIKHKKPGLEYVSSKNGHSVQSSDWLSLSKVALGE